MGTLTTAALAAHAAERLADALAMARRHLERAQAEPDAADLNARCIDMLVESTVERQREVALLAHTHGDLAVADKIGADVRTASEQMGQLAHQCRLAFIRQLAQAPA